MNWPFNHLTPFSFDVIMADPPWSFENWSEGGNKKNAKAQYACMPTAEIAALPVGHLARGDCWLWLWVTHPMLRDGIAVMDAWGFRFVTSGVWVKRGRDSEKKKGNLAFGTGYVLRTCSEPFLIGKIGNPQSFSKSVRTVLESPRRQHSRKPDEAYRTCEKLFGPANRADLFSRQSRPGWIGWGFESQKFDAGDPATMMRDRPSQEQPRLEPMALFPDAA